eukprot:COSAG01_NODE_2358_length_7838_cov_7.568807_4_plen_414_part_00
MCAPYQGGGTKRAPWPWDSPVTLGDAPETQNAACDKRRCKRERRGKRFRETGGGGALPWRSARRAAKEDLGGQTSTPSPGPRLEKLSTRESDGVVQEGGDHAKGPIGTEELIAGGSWNLDGTFTPNWSEEDRRAFIDRWGVEDAVGRWMEHNMDIAENEEELKQESWSGHERVAFQEAYGCDPIAVVHWERETMRREMHARKQFPGSKKKKKKKKKKKGKSSGEAGAALELEGASEPQQTGAGCFIEDGTEDMILEQKRQIAALEEKIQLMETDLGFERALRLELEEELEKAEEADEKAAEEAEEREKRWQAAHQEWLLARDKIVSRFNETNAAWNVECARAAAELMNVEKQLAAAEAKAVQLERELTEANAQVLEAKRGQLAAVRASKASEAAHKMTLQSKQWDRGKVRVQQ